MFPQQNVSQLNNHPYLASKYNRTQELSSPNQNNQQIPYNYNYYQQTPSQNYLINQYVSQQFSPKLNLNPNNLYPSQTHLPNGQIILENQRVVIPTKLSQTNPQNLNINYVHPQQYAPGGIIPTPQSQYYQYGIPQFQQEPIYQNPQYNIRPIVPAQYNQIPLQRPNIREAERSTLSRSYIGPNNQETIKKRPLLRSGEPIPGNTYNPNQIFSSPINIDVPERDFFVQPPFNPNYDVSRKYRQRIDENLEFNSYFINKNRAQRNALNPHFYETPSLYTYNENEPRQYLDVLPQRRGRSLSPPPIERDFIPRDFAYVDKPLGFSRLREPIYNDYISPPIIRNDINELNYSFGGIDLNDKPWSRIEFEPFRSEIRPYNNYNFGTSHYLPNNKIYESNTQTVHIKKEIDEVAEILKEIIYFERNVEKCKEELARRPDFKLVDLMNILDDNHSGQVTQTEFVVGLKKFGLHPDDNDVLLLVNRYSRDGNNKLDINEISNMIIPDSGINKANILSKQGGGKFSQETMSCIAKLFKMLLNTSYSCEQLRKEFAKKNIDLHEAFEFIGNSKQEQFLQREHLKTFLEKYYFYPSKEDMDNLCHRFDRNHSGKINFKEFEYELMPKLRS